MDVKLIQGLPEYVTNIVNRFGKAGWAQYADTQYTEAAPFRLLADQATVLPNNAGNVIDTYLPTGVNSLYDAAAQAITPPSVGDSYAFQFTFWAIPTVANTPLQLGINVGSKTLFAQHTVVWSPAGVAAPVMISVPVGYATVDMANNGGQVSITAPQDVDIYQVVYAIQLTARA